MSALLFLGLVLFLRPGSSLADGLGAELTLLALHTQTTRDAAVEHYTRRVDERGQIVVTPGAELYYDRTLAAPVLGSGTLRFTVGGFRDSVDHTFGYAAAMLRWPLHETADFAATLHLGPGLIFRESWRDQPGYRNEGLLTESSDFLPGYEHRFLPVGEIDLLWNWGADRQVVWSIVPAAPLVIWHSMGLRWNL